MVSDQTVRQAVNKKKVIGFSVTTTDGTSTSVISTSDLGSAGAQTIREIHLRCEGDNAYLGLGKAATTTPGEDVIPIFKDTTFDFIACAYQSLNVIRAATIDIKVEGFVVVN